jgi:hypothetical protein
MATSQLGATIPSLRHSHPNGSVPWVIDKSSHASAYGRMPQEFLRRNHGRLPVLTCSSPCFACRLATEVFAPGPGELSHTRWLRNKHGTQQRNKRGTQQRSLRLLDGVGHAQALRSALRCNSLLTLLDTNPTDATTRMAPISSCRIEKRVPIERWGFQRQAPGRFYCNRLENTPDVQDTDLLRKLDSRKDRASPGEATSKPR